MSAMTTKKKEECYILIAWAFGICTLAFTIWCCYVPGDPSDSLAAKANSKWAKELLNRPTGDKQTFTYRDRNGNITMQGKFTPDKPGSRSGRMEMRDAYGNRQGTINVRP